MQAGHVMLESASPQPTLTRVKKAGPGFPSHDDTSLISRVESEIYTYGLSATLAKSRASAISAGRQKAWNVLTRKLPKNIPVACCPMHPQSSQRKACVWLKRSQAYCPAKSSYHLPAKKAGRGMIMRCGTRSQTQAEIIVFCPRKIL